MNTIPMEDYRLLKRIEELETQVDRLEKQLMQLKNIIDWVANRVAEDDLK